MQPLISAFVTAGTLVAFASPAVAATCENLSDLTIAKGAVTLAHSVAPGAFAPPPGRSGGPPEDQNPFARLAAFCRVAVTLKPAPRSDIKAEVWLPVSGWNGKLQVVGNGGFAGTICYSALASAVSAGYAAASTDTGHTGPSRNTFANADALIDFAHRAVHETTVAAKAVPGATAAGHRTASMRLASDRAEPIARARCVHGPPSPDTRVRAVSTTRAISSAVRWPQPRSSV